MFKKKAVTTVQAVVLVIVIVVAAAGAYYFTRGPALPAVTTTGTQASVTPNILQLAKAEGQVTFYASWPDSINTKLATAWAAQYPDIKLNINELSSSIEAARVLSEFQGGKVMADVAEIDLSYFTVLKTIGALDRYCATNTKNIPSAFVYDKDCYVQPTIRIVPTSILYNTKLVSQSDLPADMMGILNDTSAIAKWAGKFVMGDPSRHSTTTEWLVAMRAFFNSNDTYKQFLTNLKNLKPRYVSSYIPVAEALTSGEEVMGLTIISYIASMAPAPLGYLPYKTILAGQIAFGIMKNEPHPNAARVLTEFLLSNATAKAIAAVGEMPTIPGIVPAGIKGLETLNIAPVTPLSADDAVKWQAYFKQFYGIP